MSNLIIRKVAVLGAGVMGAQIAAHLINAKVPVLLFDLPAKEGPKNAIALKAIENLKKLSPAPFGVKEDAQYIQPANYDDDIEKLAECDLVIEAIAERMDWKHDLYKKVSPHIAPNAIFASNTSGLSITELSQGFSDELKSRFCGVHFFNPPRYMHLVELIPTAATRPEILDQLETFLTSVVGKGVVRAKDTPNFIANRVGIFSILAVITEAAKFGLRFDEVDDLTGSRLGRAKSATFRTADVVGLDTMAHVIKTMQDTLKDDPFFSVYETPAVLAELVKKGALGQKTGGGFYKKEGKAIKVLDPKTGEYVDGGAKADELVGRILKRPPAERLKLLRESEHPQAQFLWSIFRDVYHYIGVHLESIADNARDVDLAIRWGFGWNEGPFEAGRRPAGSRWPSGSRKISPQARRCQARRCLRGYSKVRLLRSAVCIRTKVRGRRLRRLSCRVRRSPSTRSRCSARRWSARRVSIRRPTARRCSKPTRFAHGSMIVPARTTS